MRREGVRLAALALLAGAAVPGVAVASSAAPEITVDRVQGKVAGWSIGYGASTGGCLGAATYQDGTTVWFGFGHGADRSFLAFTNPRWRSIEIGQSYEIHLVMRGGRGWQGSFAGFERQGEKGLFTAGLKDRFVSELAAAGGVDVSMGDRRLALLSLVGSADALGAVADCQKNAGSDDTVVSPRRDPAMAADTQLRADRLGRARQAAGRVVENAAGFIRANGEDPHALDLIQRVTEIKASAAGSDPVAIERTTGALQAELAANPSYVAYRSRLDVEQRREDERYLADAIRTLAIQKAVLVRALVQDPTAAAAPQFLGLQKQAAAVIAAPDLDRAKTVMGLIDAAIQNNGLGAVYALARADAEKVTATQGRQP